LLASALGVLANPFGWGVYKVILDHMAWSEPLRHYIREWTYADLGNPLHWPFWLWVALSLGALMQTKRDRSLSTAQKIALAGLAVIAVRHRRLIPFFVSAAAAYVPGSSNLNRFKALPAASLLLTALYLHRYRPLPVPFTPIQRNAFPEGAAQFLEREQQTLSPLRMDNEWGWGGYLGYRLFPAYRVFVNGYYVFYDLLMDEMASTDRPEHWQAFLDRHRLDLAVLKRGMRDMRVGYVYPNGSVKYAMRPYYIYFMPDYRWALVYWDSVALVFVRRTAAPEKWLKAHEYRVFHPGDVAAIERAVRGGRAAAGLLHAEILRHVAESGPDPEADILFLQVL